MAELKYKVGDRVRIKSLDWYNENKDETDDIECSNNIYFYREMSKFCGKVMTISHVRADHYTMVEDLVGYWTDEMIEGLVEETKPKPKFKVGEVVYVIDYDTDLKIQNRIYKNGIWNYIINIESAPFIFYDNELKKKKEYPKTYGDCSVINGCDNRIPLIIIGEFTRLINSRNAYWRIAGQEMGLDKPWKPDWTDHELKYCIKVIGNTLKCVSEMNIQCILAFPTEEMRDAFYENFKELIKICKELL